MKRALLVLSAFAVVLLVLMATAYAVLRASLPQLDGQVAAQALSASTSIERDGLGVVTITARNREDLAFATGYAHGQDRFFQMDLQRRVAAGELSELLGKSLIDADKRFRRHAFRAVARQVVERAAPEQRRLLEAYVRGVNAALNSLGARPFEYLLLREHPAAWRVEDCILVAFAMYIDLNDSEGAHELERARLHEALPQSVYDALYPSGTEWDAPLDGADFSKTRAALPGPEEVNLRSPNSALIRAPNVQRAPLAEADYPGSNNWALAKERTAGGALVANDMHLGLRIPHIWYRARLLVRGSEPMNARDLSGVTLPGLPLLIAGSNTHIAWGFTNTHGDFDDLVRIELDPRDPNQYRNGDHYEKFVLRREQLRVRGDETIEIEYRDTVWGPLIEATLNGPLALAWTAQRADATNLNQFNLENARTVGEALEIANSSGIPVQNFVVADAEGHIGWTPIGRLPKRVGFDGKLPACWGCAAHVGWDGWVPPREYPRIVDPENGQLWSANSRTLRGEQARLIGDEDMDRGARTRQIRDDLSVLKAATPRDMLAVQLDDRAIFLSRWQGLLKELLADPATSKFSHRDALAVLIAKWSGHAQIDDAGYRLVRAFRSAAQEDIYRGLIGAAQARYPEVKFRPSARFEDTAWRIIQERPEHLLDPRYQSWPAQLAASLERAIDQLTEECHLNRAQLAQCTWGARNTLKMEHPLSGNLPMVGAWLRSPATQLPGDSDMPRVQGVAFGASERFAVSPGREGEGQFHMPGGQSGHPLSPFFMGGHEAWARGEFAPFLPGATEHTLELTPRP